MDPDTALAALVCAANDQDREATADVVQTLLDWHNSGGFLPRWPLIAIGDRMPPRVAWQLGRVRAAVDSCDRDAYENACLAVLHETEIG